MIKDVTESKCWYVIFLHTAARNGGDSQKQIENIAIVECFFNFFNKSFTLIVMNGGLFCSDHYFQMWLFCGFPDLAVIIVFFFLQSISPLVSPQSREKKKAT